MTIGNGEESQQSRSQAPNGDDDHDVNGTEEQYSSSSSSGKKVSPKQSKRIFEIAINDSPIKPATNYVPPMNLED
jgi:hypothetical protein